MINCCCCGQSPAVNKDVVDMFVCLFTDDAAAV